METGRTLSTRYADFGRGGDLNESFVSNVAMATRTPENDGIVARR